MEIAPLTYHERLKRYWRRRKYKRIYDPSHGKRRKLKILKLGGGEDDPPRRRRLWRIRRRAPKLQWMIISPIKLLAKLRDTYVDMMICLAKKMTNNDGGGGGGGGFFKSKKLSNQREVSVLVSSGEQVDSRLVLEIYKKLAASRQSLSTELL